MELGHYCSREVPTRLRLFHGKDQELVEVAITRHFIIVMENDAYS